MLTCMPRSGFFGLAFATGLALALATARAATSDPSVVESTDAIAIAAPDALASLPPYLPKAPVEGELTVAGSSAMNHLAQLWASGLGHLHSGAKLKIDMYESGQVLPRLAKGEMQIGLMSRPLTEKELKDGGVVAFATAKDVLGIVVNSNNPLDALTLEQGVTLLRDPSAPQQPGAKTWGQLGLEGEWKNLPITLYGRTAGAGAWGYLVNRFLGEGAPSRGSTDCTGYADICQHVTKDRGGVGYVSLSLAPPKAGEQVDPRYPLVRELYVVLKWKQGEPMSPLAEEFLHYVLSRSGQEDVVKAGFIPLRRDEVLASRDQLGWTGKR
jgi:phosphate transport system substrate-binding protein